VPRGTATAIKTSVELQPRLIAPLTTDTVVGQLKVTEGAQSLATVPLHPLANDALGGAWRRLVDTVKLWFN
jgi:D-alanyl-D-alanine carboxypeptidase (penicillin-binding protein 5/6)